MAGRIGVFTAVLATMMVAGCSTGTFLDDVGTLWGDDSAAEIETRQRAAEARQTKVPMQAVNEIEMGRTRDGFLLTAFGTAPGLGYALPTLQIRRDGRPSPDGFLEFDFVASPPAPGLNLPNGTTRTRAVRADLPLKARLLRGTAGVRVFALSNASQIVFGTD